MEEVKMFRVLLCFWYLAVVVADPTSMTDNAELRASFKKVISELDDKNIIAKEQYWNERKNTFIIEENLLDRQKIFLKEVMDINNIKTGSEKTSEFTTSILTVKELFYSLEENRLKRKPYERFLEKASKELFDLKEIQVQEWKKIENHLADYEPSHKQEKIDRTSKDEIYLENYTEFIFDLYEFLNTNKVFKNDQNSINELIDVYTKYIDKSKLCITEEKTLYTDMLLCSILRNMVQIIYHDIYIPDNNVLKEASFNLDQREVEDCFVRKGIELEAQKYAKHDKLKGINNLFNSLAEHTSRIAYYMLENILEVKIEKVQGSIRIRYDIIRRKIEELFKKGAISTIKLPKNFNDKIDELLDYNERVIDAVVKTIDSDNYTKEQKNINTSLFTLNNRNHSVTMRDKILNKDDVMNWFEMQGSPDAKNAVFNFNNEVEWIENMHIGLDKTDKERKDALVIFCTILDNISTIFCIIYGKLLETSDIRNYSAVYHRINYANEIVRAVCYAVKLKKVKKIVNCEIPSYPLYVAKLVVNMQRNKNSHYPVVNRKNYLKIKNLGYMYVVLREKKTQQAIKYLQVVIKQLNELNRKMGVFINKDDLKKQNKLTEKLCSVNIEQDIKPSKSFLLTEQTRIEIKKCYSNNSK